MKTAAAYALMCLLALVLATVVSHLFVEWMRPIVSHVLLSLNAH